jgi:hypothetical protein
MPTPTLVIGKTYEVDHLHKGRMTMQITYQDAIWISGFVISEFHVSEKELTIRKAHCKVVEVGEG